VSRCTECLEPMLDSEARVNEVCFRCRKGRAGFPVRGVYEEDPAEATRDHVTVIPEFGELILVDGYVRQASNYVATADVLDLSPDQVVREMTREMTEA
jgi:hypothetical protein